MRAPDRGFASYSDGQWAEIKHVLARVDVDIDAVQVPRLFLLRPGEYETRQWSLRREIELLARLAASMTTRPRRPTRKQRIRELTAALRVGAVYRDYLLPNSSAMDVVADLERYIERDLNELKTNKQSSKNASKPELTCFCEQLLDTWNRTVGAPTKRGQRKLLLDYLFACAHPIFPTTRIAIEKWLERRQTSA
jgi:hypothetical protein